MAFKKILATHRQLGIEQVRWLSIIDFRTCKACADRNEKVFSLAEVAKIRRHRGCRCTVTGVWDRDDPADRSPAQHGVGVPHMGGRGMHCPKCRAQSPWGSKFCNTCGHALDGGGGNFLTKPVSSMKTGCPTGCLVCILGFLFLVWMLPKTPQPDSSSQPPSQEAAVTQEAPKPAQPKKAAAKPRAEQQQFELPPEVPTAAKPKKTVAPEPAKKVLTLAQVKPLLVDARRLQAEVLDHVPNIPVGAPAYYEWMNGWFDRNRAIQARIWALLDASNVTDRTQPRVVLENLSVWEHWSFTAVTQYNHDSRSTPEVRLAIQNCTGALKKAESVFARPPGFTTDSPEAEVFEPK